MKLYEIEQNYIDFMAAVEAGDIPDEAITDTLEAIQGEFENKADNIACLIKSCEAEADAIKQEETALKGRRDVKTRQIDRLRHYLSEAMQHMGIAKLETPRNVR